MRSVMTLRMADESVVQLNPKTYVRGRLVEVDQSDRKVHAFLGVPYALPPVGDLRFKPTKALVLSEGTLDATDYGPVCPQAFGPLLRAVQKDDLSTPNKVSEDCLYLNVWTPSPKKGEQLPVMVWIHGGACSHGYTNYFNGAGLAEKENVVVVTMNYRLGIFGFLYLGTTGAQGNMALHDMVEALRWVQTHIEAFGGDKNNVTLFGESAGSICVNILLFSKEAKGLFHKAICQSNILMYPNCIHYPEQAKREVISRVQEKGCLSKDADEVFQWINSKSSQELVESLMDYFFPVVDGKLVVDHNDTIYQRHEFSPIPFLNGFNDWEGSFYEAVWPGRHRVFANREMAKETIETLFIGIYCGFHPNDHVKRLFEAAWQLYVGDIDTNPGSITASVQQLLGDGLFVSMHVEASSIHAKKGSTYMYQFTHRPSKSTRPAWVGADHTDEIAFVFGFPFTKEPDTWPPEEKNLSRMMMSYWANFARTGDPNGEGLPKWEAYTNTSQHFMILSCDPRLSAHHNAARMLFWNVTAPKILQGEY